MEKLNLQDFLSDKPYIKYPCTKKAIALSKENPETLYPDFDFFLQFLNGENKILKWTALTVIGNLAAVDTQKKTDKLIPILISFLSDKTMVTAANAAKALSEIAYYKPEYREEILSALLKVEKAVYLNKGEISPECTNVAIGGVIACLPKFGEDVYQRGDVKAFLKRQTKNTRKKVREMVEKLWLKYVENLSRQS